MSEGFVALAARGDKKRIAAHDGLLRRFSGMGTKRTLPEHRLGILEIAADEKLHFVIGRGEINDSHLAAQAVKRVIAGGDDATGGVEDEIAIGIFLKRREHFIEDGDFFREVLRFALGVSRAVRPAHPRCYAINAGVAAGFQNGSEARFDFVVAADRGAAESREIFRPVGFAGSGHADERKAKRLIGMCRHVELKSVKDAGEERNKKSSSGAVSFGMREPAAAFALGESAIIAKAGAGLPHSAGAFSAYLSWRFW